MPKSVWISLIQFHYFHIETMPSSCRGALGLRVSSKSTSKSLAFLRAAPLATFPCSSRTGIAMSRFSLTLLPTLPPAWNDNAPTQQLLPQRASPPHICKLSLCQSSSTRTRKPPEHFSCVSILCSCKNESPAYKSNNTANKRRWTKLPAQPFQTMHS